MQTVLKEKLWAYLVHNYPDLLLELQENGSLETYLEEKVSSILPLTREMLSAGSPSDLIEEYCLNAMVEELWPSKYSYIRLVLEEEFPRDYDKLERAGTLVFELLNMLKACQSVFEDFGFDHQSLGSNKLRHAVIACVHDCLIK